MEYSDTNSLLAASSMHHDDGSGIRFHHSPMLCAIPNVFHGFTTRLGGVSEGAYSSLNLGTHVGDDNDRVMENRRRTARAAGFAQDAIATAEQVHGAEVAIVTKSGGPVKSVDALITNTAGVLLMLMFADCVPIVLCDPVRNVVAVIHSGWKGTSANIVRETVLRMSISFGSKPEECLAAIGPCISFENYEVCVDVASRFQQNISVGEDCTANDVLSYNIMAGKYLLNLRRVVFQQLLSEGLSGDSISVSRHCTYKNQREFFSHRRDGIGGTGTGRMAALIGIWPLERSMENR